jgi:PBP1b-binding outer membrane lipoprotein LpoB
MNRTHAKLLLVAFAMAFAGCKKTDAPAPAASTTATAVPTTTAPAAAVDPNDIPTSEDFEQEALDQINAQNLDTELDKLERDIGT